VEVSVAINYLVLFKDAPARRSCDFGNWHLIPNFYLIP